MLDEDFFNQLKEIVRASSHSSKGVEDFAHFIQIEIAVEALIDYLDLN